MNSPMVVTVINISLVMIFNTPVELWALRRRPFPGNRSRLASDAPAHAHQTGSTFVVAISESGALQIVPGIHVHPRQLRHDRTDTRLAIAPSHDRPHQGPGYEGAAIARQAIGPPTGCPRPRPVNSERRPVGEKG